MGIKLSISISLPSGSSPLGDPLTLTGLSVTPSSGGTSASMSVNVNSEEGTVYFVVLASGSAVPSEAQIKAGTDGNDVAAVWDGSAAVTAVDTYVVGPGGLIQDTTYIVYAVHEDLTPAYSNVVSSTFSTTDEVPALTSPTDAANGPDAATLGVTTDDPNGTIYWVVTTSDTTPTHAQIVAGQDHTGTAAAASGSLAVTSAGAKTGIAASGLTAATTYYAHFTQADAATNAATPVSADGFTTASSETVDFAHWDDGTVDLNLPAGWTSNTSQSDPDGGSTAIQALKADGVTTNSVQINRTYHNGVNILRLKVKINSWTNTSGFRCLRLRYLNLTQNPAVYIDLDTISFRTSTSSTSSSPPAPFAYGSVTDLGSGWIGIELAHDKTGQADLSGVVELSFSSSVVDGSIASADVVDVALNDYTLSHPA